MTDIVNENYKKLAGLLKGRKDWQPREELGERGWCFGVGGASRLAIIPEPDGFSMYGPEEKRLWFFPDTDAVKEWLAEHEQEYAGPTALQLEFKEALERARRRRGGGADT